MSFEQNLKRGVLFGFIPNRLEIKERPELIIFPFNVLFGQYAEKEGKTIMGTAVYEPDLESIKKKDNVYSMIYHNAYGGKSWLVIEFNLDDKSYVGTKFVDGKSVGMATGMVWNMFFTHYTALGLTAGEKCKFDDVV